ncbi:MAG: 6,7-dimethyl-8-ribityllumazine synthase [Candidatus Marinimicrobia bacterium]|nr:6,7-dimethyl-8-ribityllumazine synthase [Candidatus Neomarinimicrobiota bacterium]MBL7023646.1 6,7-dimethyl-8-ribityllumazine synthase [Candidatus Neomarinimicrobiota bacterium]MBL7109798.1 6,7-dimethyl-8-ribityllumazine synthase [Candidatus Neomarinimicrobiota bacterium]
MTNIIVGKPFAKGKKIHIVVGEFNEIVSDSLLNGAVDAYCNFGGNPDDLTIIKVPGAFEIPGAVKIAVENSFPDAVVTLGAIIRGGTPHFDFVATESSRRISELSLKYNIPVMFGILTTNDLKQALERAGTKAANKGWEVMESALKTISVYEQISDSETF